MRRNTNQQAELPLGARLLLGLDRVANWAPDSVVQSNRHPEKTGPVYAFLEHVAMSVVQGATVGHLIYAATGDQKASILWGSAATIIPYATRGALMVGSIVGLSKLNEPI